MERIADSVLNVVRLIVDKPEEVAIEIVKQERDVHLRLSISPDDVGKVVGKQGRTVRSLRTLLAAMSKTRGQAMSLEILE